MSTVKRQYDYAVFIGRFEPFHHAHKRVVDKALSVADKFIVQVGSASKPRSIKDPFFVEERKVMTRSAFAPATASRLLFGGLRDFPYNDQRWASRAGEHGQGFAVVASEVRSLDQRSAAAAREIKVLIFTSVEQVERESPLVSEAGDTIRRMVSEMDRVSQTIQRINHATSEQRSGIQEVSAAVAQIDHMTQQNAALVEQSSAAAETLKNQAESLGSALTVFRLDASSAASAS